MDGKKNIKTANAIRSSLCDDLISVRAGPIAKAQIQSIHFLGVYAAYSPNSSNSFFPLSQKSRGAVLLQQRKQGLSRPRNGL